MIIKILFGGLLGTGGANKVSLLSSKSSSYTTIETAKSESTNLTLAAIIDETCKVTSNSNNLLIKSLVVF
jgi:hypothetical protein